MDELERDPRWRKASEYHKRNTEKYNEFHKNGQKEDRTTAEIIEIATALEDGATIGCMTWLWPNMRLMVTLDNQLQNKVVDIALEVSNADHYTFPFTRYDTTSIQRHKHGPWRNGFDMSITDVAECFGLDDQKIKNP